MAERRSAEQVFQDLLEGNSPRGASPQAEQLAKLAGALRAEPAAPSSQFKARLRSQLLAQASESPEELFAAALDGMLLEAPAEARALVSVASALEPARLPLPDPNFRYQLRARLIAEAATPETLTGRVGARVAALNDRMRRSLRGLVAGGMTAAVLAGSSAAMAASGAALPGDTLYGVKRFRESAQLVVVAGATEGERLLDFAAVRLGELRSLTERSETEQALYTTTIDEMDRLTILGSTILVEEYIAERISSERLGHVRRFAQVQAQDLKHLAPLMPAGAQPAVQDSLDALERLELRVEDVLAGCECSSNPLESSGVPSAGKPAASTAPGCACDRGTGRTPTGSGSNNDGNSNNPGPGDDDPNPDPDPDPTPEPPENTDDIPDLLPGDDTDDQVTDPIDDLIDDLTDPLPAPPSGGTLPTLPPITLP